MTCDVFVVGVGMTPLGKHLTRQLQFGADAGVRLVARGHP